MYFHALMGLISVPQQGKEEKKKGELTVVSLKRLDQIEIHMGFILSLFFFLQFRQK